MISEKNYERMATEVLEIINLYPKDTREKIPKRLISELEKHRLPNFNVKLNKNKKVYEQDICDESLVFIYMIYRDYIAGPEEKAYFDNILNKFDEEIRMKCNPDNLFKSKEEKK